MSEDTPGTDTASASAIKATAPTPPATTTRKPAATPVRRQRPSPPTHPAADTAPTSIALAPKRHDPFQSGRRVWPD